MRSVIFDLDGTLADISHRVHFVNGTPFPGARVTVEKTSESVERGKQGKIIELVSDKVALVLVSADKDAVECSVASLKVHPDWDRFFDGINEDQPVGPTIDLLNSLKRDYSILLCSGRPETYRQQTTEWLSVHAIHHDALYMREQNDRRADPVIKNDFLKRIRNDGYDPFLVVDDRTSVVEMWRKEGLTCLQCAEGNF
jgi:phosphoglycolate phosphatase-like HAD superfamily hydrolase